MERKGIVWQLDEKPLSRIFAYVNTNFVIPSGFFGIFLLILY